MKTAKAGKPAGQQSGTASPKPRKSWSKVAASGGAGRPAQEPQAHRDAVEELGATSHERLLSILSGLVNTEAEVSTKGGARYRGLVKTVDTRADVAVVLKNARQIKSGVEGTNGSDVKPEVSIRADDLVEVYAARLDLGGSSTPASQAPSPAQKTPAWKTDTDISGRTQVKERVLQAWQPPPDDEGFSIEDDLAPPVKNGGPAKKWDQFAANEKLFGVKSQWDEDVYTHKLDTSKPDFARRRVEAERLAREIEQSSSTNAHVLEERGQEIDDSGMTEEDKYSGVQRNPNAWVPPARRPTAVNIPAPRVQAADPAIIASQLAKPGTTGHRSVASVVNTPQKTADATNAASTGKVTNQIETDIMARFKQFATNERDRLSVKKAATFKKEKDGRLQDLLAFSKDFKLTTPVPEDLIPILAKDKAKQEAIVQKAASSTTTTPSLQASSTISPPAPPTETKPAETLKSRVDKAHRSPAPKTPTPLTKEQSSELKKLKPSAAEFKPFNPAASSFTPSVQRVPTTSSPALSTSSSQPRQTPFSADAASFFPRKPKPLEERTPILDQFDPFKTYAAKNPDSSLDIETPLKVDPSWPSPNTNSITDAPVDARRPAQSDEHFQMPPQQYMAGMSPQLMYLGSPQQAHGFAPQAYYKQGQQFMPAPPGQFVPYQGALNFVPPQYIYQGMQAYNARPMQPIPGYVPQQVGGYNQQMNVAPQLYNSNNNVNRTRQSMSGGQRPTEVQKPVPRPPPMSSDAPKDS